jgi:hypothetical protein
MNPEQNSSPTSEPQSNDCMQIIHPYSVMIQFVGKRMIWGFDWSLLNYFVLKANPDCHDPKVEPAQELIFYFHAAKVTLLGLPNKVTTEPITRRDFNLMFAPAAESVSGISQTVAINIEIEAKHAE